MTADLTPGDQPAARRPPNSIADVVRVAGVLRADASALRAAAIMLGLAVAPLVPRSAGAPPPVRLLPPASAVSPPRPALPEAEDGSGTGIVRPAGLDPRPPRRPRLVLTEPAVTAPPRPLRGSVIDLLPAPVVAAQPAEPLLEPSHQRAVLSALAAVDRAGREVDVDALVERVARRYPIGQVPRRVEPTTRLGVRLVLDHGPSMGPFRRDLRLLATALRHVVGADTVEALAIRGDLRTVVPLSGDDDEPRAFAPVAPRPVLVASDLGAGSTRPVDWLRFADGVREAGCPLVVLNPYPPDRWPVWAYGRLTLVHWDRSTDAGQARRAARRAAQLAGLRR